MGINAYPTTILYNNSKPHKYQGHHDAGSIVEFIRVCVQRRLRYTERSWHAIVNINLY